MGINLFIFAFHDRDLRLWISTCFCFKIMLVRDSTLGYSNAKSPFWVRVFNLPLRSMTRDVGQAIREVIGFQTNGRWAPSGIEQLGIQHPKRSAWRGGELISQWGKKFAPKWIFFFCFLRLSWIDSASHIDALVGLNQGEKWRLTGLYGHPFL